MTHPVLEDLNRRYTTKKYDSSRRIPANDMVIIKEALRLSPSSVNSQPWKFIVIESEAAKERLHNTFANKFQMNQKHAKEASHVILFAYNPQYTKEDYSKVIDDEINTGRLSPDKADERTSIGMFFAELHADENGYNPSWTKAQTYLALGNALHTAARLGIDSTPMEGVDTELIGEVFKEELEGFICETALALGYHLDGEDYNHDLPKARLPLEDIIITL